MLKLELISGPQKGRLVRISDDAPVPIGRNFGRLRLHDSRVSKNHAEIIYAGDGSWVLRDLGSSNGSFVNQEQLTSLVELEKGDTIQFGRVVIRVRQADHKGVKTTADDGPSPDALFAAGAGIAQDVAMPTVPDVAEDEDDVASEEALAGAAEEAGGEVDLDITPMIDVVFLLLIYFMFLPLQQEADIGIKLPSDAPPAENLDLPSEHIVEIFPNGLILLNGAPMDGIDDRNMNRLSTTLTRLKLSSDRAGIDTVVKIQADPDSPHQRSIDVLNASAKAKITKVSFASYAE